MAEAACRGHRVGAFFPADDAGVEAARAVCLGCPVRESCLDYALAEEIAYGVWGGRSERERRRLARSRRAGRLRSLT